MLEDSMFYSMSAISILVMNVLWSQEEERREEKKNSFLSHDVNLMPN